MNAPTLATFYREHPDCAPRPPIRYLAEGRDDWVRGWWGRDVGQVLAPIAYERVYVLDEHGRKLAAAYAALPDHDPDAWPAFRTFADELVAQYRYLTDALGVVVTITSTDPYKNHHELREALQARELAVLSSQATGGHPLFTDQVNDAFRAVHDAFGHGATGRGFDRHGEDASWLSHSRMFSPLASYAMTTETRGQNSAMNYGDSEGFPPQKIALMPPWASRGATFAPLPGDQS